MKDGNLFMKVILLLHPLDVAEVILKAVNSNNPEIRYLVGKDAVDKKDL